MAIVKWSPRWLVNCYAAFLTMLWRFFARKDQERVFRNLNFVFSLPKHSSFARAFVTQTARHQIASGLETVKASFDPKQIEVRDLEPFFQEAREVLAAKKGLIVVTGHLGSWELVGHFSAVAAYTFHALAKPAKWPPLTAALDALRGRYGITVLWSNRKSLLKDMLAVLHRGEALGFVMDQKPDGRAGPQVTFLGKPTEFVGGPAAVALKTGAPIMGVFCMREGPWRYRMIWKTLLQPDHGLEDVQAATQIMATEIERVIRLYPEQWAWNYRRWRRPRHEEKPHESQTLAEPSLPR